MNSNGFVDVTERIHVDALWAFFRHGENVRLTGNSIVTLSTTKRFALSDEK